MPSNCLHSHQNASPLTAVLIIAQKNFDGKVGTATADIESALDRYNGMPSFEKTQNEFVRGAGHASLNLSFACPVFSYAQLVLALGRCHQCHLAHARKRTDLPLHTKTRAWLTSRPGLDQPEAKDQNCSSPPSRGLDAFQLDFSCLGLP